MVEFFNVRLRECLTAHLHIINLGSQQLLLLLLLIFFISLYLISIFCDDGISSPHTCLLFTLFFLNIFEHDIVSKYSK